MVKGKMFCPMIKTDCKEEKCAFWIQAFDHCAVNWIAQCLEDQTETLSKARDDVLDILGG